MEGCPGWVPWIKYHHRTEITGRVHQGKITVQLYLLCAAAGFLFSTVGKGTTCLSCWCQRAPETQGCWKAHDTVCICSYVHIRLRLGFKSVPYCGVHWAVTRCPPHVTMPLWIKKSRVWAPVVSVPHLLCNYLHCSKMNDSILGVIIYGPQFYREYGETWFPPPASCWCLGFYFLF